MRVVLGSLSPRRRELIKKVVPTCDMIASKAEEKITERLPERAVAEVAKQKMSFFDGEEYKDALIITADTVVYFEGEILGKPHSVEQAKEMLSRLSGKTHIVYTGVCLKLNEKEETFVETSRVVFRELSEKEILDYIATGSPFDKAGAYGVQDSGFVREIIGSYDNVMGLPTEELKLRLNSFPENANA